MAERHYWLMKSEPGVYSIDDLKKDRTTYWDGVRNYQARNLLRDRIKKGDRVFFYHSNAKPPGIAGIAEVVEEGFPDPSAFDARSKYYDASATRDKPVWYAVRIRFLRKCRDVLPLESLKGIAELKDMPLLQRGQRLSVQPVTAGQWKRVEGMLA